MTISIIIPVYNKIRYIEKLLSQIKEQSFGDYECLLIDDGSTDGSAQVCDKFAKEDGRFKAFHIKNGGVSRARNAGLDAAAGSYITFIDADDEITRDYLQNLYDCIVQSGADMVIGGHSKFWDNRDDIVPVKSPYTPGLYQISDIISCFATIQRQFGMYGWCVAKLLPKELIGETRFTEGLTLAEDFDFYLKIYPKVKTIFFDDKPKYLYRLEADNCSVAKDDNDIDYFAQLKVNLRYREFLIKMGAWTGENQKIVEQLLSNYAFFVLFHSSLDDYRKKFDELYKVLQNEKIVLHHIGFLQRILLYTLCKNKKVLSKSIMRVYRCIRRLRKH